MDHAGADFTQFFTLILIALVVALAARRLKIPYALALVVTGLAVGISRLLPQVHLDPVVLLTIFLPPLLFESALHLRIDELRGNWKPITIYTLAGTILSTFIIGGLMAWMLRLPLNIALVFGALISTTDPISVITIFKKLGAGRRLTLIMEAESLFNDGMGVVLFTVFVGIALGARSLPIMNILQFAQLVAGGVLVGAVIGLVASRIHYEIDDHLIEITLTSVVAFGSYLLAEKLHTSGVMAVVAAGLVIGNYGMPATMSAGTRLAVTAFWEYSTFVVNSIVFLLIGIEVAHVDWINKIWLTIGAIFIVLSGRAAIYPLSFLVNRLKGDIPLAWQHVFVWGGLRGALSMALVLGLRQDFPHRSELIAATFGVVLFSLLVQGMTVGTLIRKLGLTGEKSSEPKDQRRLASEIMACEAALFELNRIRAMEAYANWAIELLALDYSNRLVALNSEMRSLAPNFIDRQEQKSVEAQKLALTAEKSALHQAEKEGRLDEEDWRQLQSRIDAELVAITLKANH